MKRSLVATAVSSGIVLSILGLSCAEPHPSGFQQQTVQPAYLPRTPEDMLEDMRLSTMWSMEETATRGQNSADYLYVTLRDIEEAQKALRELEAQRQATQSVIDGYILGGEMIPGFQMAILESIEQARREILRRTGLAQ